MDYHFDLTRTVIISYVCVLVFLDVIDLTNMLPEFVARTRLPIALVFNYWLLVENQLPHTFIYPNKTVTVDFAHYGPIDGGEHKKTGHGSGGGVHNKRCPLYHVSLWSATEGSRRRRNAIPH